MALLLEVLKILFPNLHGLVMSKLAKSLTVLPSKKQPRLTVLSAPDAGRTVPKDRLKLLHPSATGCFIYSVNASRHPLASKSRPAPPNHCRRP
jgi:hypothetical protein